MIVISINTVIATNVMALNAHRRLATVGNKQSKASQRLSSGLKINSAADDSAGLAISQKMKAQIRGLNMAEKNCEDAISLVQTAEGSVSEMQSMLQRARELAVQGANDINSEEDRTKIATEMLELINELYSMADRTEFNGMSLISPEGSQFNFQIGANTGQSIYVTLPYINFKAEGAAALAYDIDETLKASIEEFYGGYTYDSMGNIIPNPEVEVNGTMASSGTDYWLDSIYEYFQKMEDPTTLDNKFDYQNGVREAFETMKQKASEFYDNADTPQELKELFKEMCDVVDNLITLGNSLNGEQLYSHDNNGNFNANPACKDQYEAMKNSVSTMMNLQKKLVDTICLRTTSLSEVKSQLEEYLSDPDDASITLNHNYFSVVLFVMDKGIDYMSDIRANLGATQNRLEYTINNLKVSSENLSSANSRIEDADMAEEMMELTKSNVLQQAAISMLAQANQAPNNITQLLNT